MVFFLLHFPRNFGALRQYLAIMVPHNFRFRIGFNATIHDNQLASIFRPNTWFFVERRRISFGLWFSFNIQIQIGVTFTIFVFHVTPIRAAIRPDRILRINECYNEYIQYYLQISYIVYDILLVFLISFRNYFLVR